MYTDEEIAEEMAYRLVNEGRKNRLKPSDVDEHETSAGDCACPYCKSTTTYYAPIEISGGYARQEVTCDDCKKEWAEIYKMIGIHDFTHEETIYTTDRY